MDSYPLPPHSLRFDGPPDDATFLANGADYLAIYKLCGLKPDAKMLDVGSGVGRKTLPLTGYLNSDAVYEGIDPVLSGVQWCQENISSRYPNFRFQHADIHAPGYNPFGEIKPTEFVFPFKDDTFDFVTLCSVFTHMRFDDVQHYLKEIHRVLKPDGLCLTTWFLLGDWLPNDLSHFPFAHKHGKMAQRDFPEAAIAYEAESVADLFTDADLDIEVAHYGSWSGRPGFTYQDIIIAAKGLKEEQ